MPVGELARGGSCEGASSAADEMILRANSEAYEWLVDRILRSIGKEKPARLLDLIQTAAWFAMRYHSGRFTDGVLENLLSRLGAELGDMPERDQMIGARNTRRSPRRCVLHVATRVHGIGGHTRTISHWVKFDRSSDHALAVVDQGGIAVPSWLSGELERSGVEMVVLEQNASPLSKAASLRRWARRFDLIVLHHNPDDVVPSLAFAHDGMPPVAVLNHGDHLFWLGSAITDVCINLRAVSVEISALRRHIPSNVVLPIPIDDLTTRPSRMDARKHLRIPESQIVLLSVGREEKYRPCGPYDFVATAGRILDQHPLAHLYIVGESFAGIKPYLRSEVHSRLHFMGSVEDPSLFRSAADIYLETSPFGSSTALLEAGLASLPVVSSYCPLSPLLVGGSDALGTLTSNPDTEAEYIERAAAFIHDPHLRTQTGLATRIRLAKDHVGDGWNDRLRLVYDLTDRVQHTVRVVPDAVGRTTDIDIGLSHWRYFGNEDSGLGALPSPAAAHCHHAFVAKRVGDYRTALRESCSSLAHAPGAAAPWRILADTLLRGRGSQVRRVAQQIAAPVQAQLQRIAHSRPQNR